MFVASPQDWRRLHGALHAFHRVGRYLDPWLVIGIEISLGRLGGSRRHRSRAHSNRLEFGSNRSSAPDAPGVGAQTALCDRWQRRARHRLDRALLKRLPVSHADQSSR